MSAETIGIQIGIAIAEAGFQAYKDKDDAETVADKIIAILLQFVPREKLAAFLTQNGVELGEAAADIAEDVKFPRP